MAVFAVGRRAISTREELLKKLKIIAFLNFARIMSSDKVRPVDKFRGLSQPPPSGRAIAQTVSRWLPTAAARVQVGFAVDKVELGQVFSEYFGFPYLFSFHQILHHHNHPGQVQ
jgi:hypothetical protein